MPPSPSPRTPASAPPLRDRGDACPGALRLHSAADGRLARVRIPAGDLTVRQAAALAEAADRLGDGSLSLTSRGNVELRGLSDDCGGPLAALLHDAGLLPSARHERIRNILASPLAGLDRHTPADVRLWARSLDALLCASASATALSGRFLFVLDDGRGDVAALGGDVSLVAEAAAADAGDGTPSSALLRVGDDPAALRIAGADAARAALTAAEAFLAAAEASGSGAWRVRELPDGHRLNAPAVAEALRSAGIEAAYVPEPPPGPHLGTEDVPEAPGAHLATECVPTEAAGPDLATEHVPMTAGPRRSAGDSATPGIVEGADGRRALSVLAPLGRLTTAQWRLLTTLADRDGSGALRLTPWRGIVLPGLSAATAGNRLAELSDAGLITDPSSPWFRLSACTGRPGCAKSLTDVRADAATAVASAGRIPGGARGERAPGEPAPGGPTALVPIPAPGTPLPGTPVHWSGCARRCGHPHGTWTDVLATADGYQVTAVGPGTPPPTPGVTPDTPPAPPPAAPDAPPSTPDVPPATPDAPPAPQETRPQ
ncbi:cobalamin biosynthesis protein CobG [Streptomyces sp. NPDC056411]|uniref:cobalamin biosynthesis protein CobG n=1 Tax=Streptomyces sp. NPDC056411 TaxID=3345813 RepID=UPI0035DD97C6